MNTASRFAIDLTEQGLVPDALIRKGIRFLLKQRLQEIYSNDTEKMADSQYEFIRQMQDSSIALVPDLANQQHYEVPSRFFEYVLGPHLKYSSAYWPSGATNLEQAELAGLEETVQHAQLFDGQRVLELGCGWGSLTLFMASKFPNSQITAISNSGSQRDFIESRAQKLNLNNIKIITRDMNEFDTENNYYDRIVSVEMFEHMRNWDVLYSKVARWLKPGGKFFKHIFVHRDVPYEFEDNGPGDWMSRYFFSGGMMPSDDLPLFFQKNLNLIKRWRWGGRHYAKTAEAWLSNMDQHREEILPLIQDTYGEQAASMWWSRWRLFFHACSELFGFENGQHWFVSHYLFEKPVR